VKRGMVGSLWRYLNDEVGATGFEPATPRPPAECEAEKTYSNYTVEADSAKRISFL